MGPSAERQIANLLARYAELIDAGDFEGVADLLGEALVGAIGRTDGIRGRQEILDLYRSTTRRHADGTPRTRHLVTNLWLEVDEEAGEAAARSTFTVLQDSDRVPLQPVAVGRYADRFRRHADRWRFSERRFALDLTGDLSDHLLPGAGPA